MPSYSLNLDNEVIYALNVHIKPKEERPRFKCPECGNRMVFVECERKINHFRHYNISNCEFESEPETEEHYYAKGVVENIFANFVSTSQTTILYGKELPVVDNELDIKKYPDVYLEIPSLGKKIAVEVQYTNYDIRTFRNKILFYAFRNITAIYLFFGEQFQKRFKENNNIYLLKDIEKEIFYKNSLPVHGGYLFYDKNNDPYIEVPQFKPKYKKGNYDYCLALPYDRYVEIACCKTRFIKEFNPVIVKLNDWLYSNCFKQVPMIPSKDLCNHRSTSYQFSDGKIKRYKEVCSICKKFVRWLPKSEAIALGLDDGKSC
jgi:predicted RNA-binding Zn-ribbon protein involved in translation (DUF1610 family)